MRDNNILNLLSLFLRWHKQLERKLERIEQEEREELIAEMAKEVSDARD